jgi:hypothetical protein
MSREFFLLSGVPFHQTQKITHKKYLLFSVLNVLLGDSLGSPHSDVRLIAHYLAPAAADSPAALPKSPEVPFAS